MKRFVPWIALIIALLIVASVVRQCRNDGAANYQTASVTHGAITQAVTATGTLNPVVNVQVGSQVSGNIAKLLSILIPKSKPVRWLRKLIRPSFKQRSLRPRATWPT